MGLRVGGLASGLDSSAIIDALLRFERRPLQLLQQKKQTLESQQALFRDLNTALLALRDSAAAIDNQNTTLTGPASAEELLSSTATSSHDTLVTATASASATPGSFSLTVDRLASTGREFSAAFADATSSIASAGDTLTLTVGTGTPFTVTVGSTGASLNDLRDLVNSDPNNGGSVRADVLFDGTSYRLVLSPTATGAANDLTVTTTIPGPGGAAFVDPALEQVAQDAQVTVFGSIPVTRPSNDISDAIPGLTLHLKGADPATTVRIDVARDDDAIAQKVQDFIDSFNAVVDFIDTKAGFDSTAQQAGPLLGDATVRSVQAQLGSVVVKSYSFAGNSFTSLGQIGIQIGRDGRLSLDRSLLDQRLSEDSQGVRQLLAGDGTTDGAATALARAIDPLTQTGTGLLATRDDGFDSQIRSLADQIARFEDRLAKREETLVAQFTALETAISALNSQGNALSGLLNFSSSRNG